ncbi:hypothetical protein BH09MYX1_BH09MYX1_24810 [soil metagenome]
MHFEISHDFEIPRDAVELAVISPDLFSRLRARLTNMEEVRQKQHVLTDGVLNRVWAFQANVKVPVFAKKVVTREMLSWDEISRYDLEKHMARWEVHPNVKPEWKKYFQAQGTYRLEAIGSAQTRRIIEGDLELRVPVVKGVAERAILGEIRKTFDAEADTLRDLATLA